MATNLDAVKTPTNIRSTFAVDDDKTENFGKRRLQDKKKYLGSCNPANLSVIFSFYLYDFNRHINIGKAFQTLVNAIHMLVR